MLQQLSPADPAIFRLLDLWCTSVLQFVSPINARKNAIMNQLEAYLHSRHTVHFHYSLTLFLIFRGSGSKTKSTPTSSCWSLVGYASLVQKAGEEPGNETRICHNRFGEVWYIYYWSDCGGGTYDLVQMFTFT